MDIKIIFEDQDLLVLDKPAGVVVNRSDTTKGEETVQDFVEKHLNIPTPQPQARLEVQDGHYAAQAKQDFISRSGIVHRLDKETSGILLVAKNVESFINLQAQFKERKVQKTYVALAHGKIEPQEGEINVAVGRLPWNRKRFGVLSGGRESVTEYKVLSILRYKRHSGKPKAHPESDSGQARMTGIEEPLTLVELYPKSGRTHQIRVHLQYIHHPIFGDPLYGGRKTSRQDRKLLPLVFLHAAKISFYHPARNASSPASQAVRGGLGASVAGGPKTNELISFESSLPDDLNKFLISLKS